MRQVSSRASNRLLTLVVAILVLQGGTVLACSLEPDERDLVTRLNDEKMSFIGRIKSVTSEQTVFDVLVPLRGVTTRTFTMKHGTSSCNWQFAAQDVGTMWVYAGDHMRKPTVYIPTSRP